MAWMVLNWSAKVLRLSLRHRLIPEILYKINYLIGRAVGRRVGWNNDEIRDGMNNCVSGIHQAEIHAADYSDSDSAPISLNSDYEDQGIYLYKLGYSFFIKSNFL